MAARDRIHDVRHRLIRTHLDGPILSEEAIERAESLYRATDKERLSKQIAAGDLRAARGNVLTEPQLHDPARNTAD